MVISGVDMEGNAPEANGQKMASQGEFCKMDEPRPGAAVKGDRTTTAVEVIYSFGDGIVPDLCANRCPDSPCSPPAPSPRLPWAPRTTSACPTWAAPPLAC